MKILVVETATATCSVALLEDNHVLYEENTENGFTHSENLLPMIKEAFDRTGLTLSQIDLYAASIGPGSFTGIRIGIATLKAFIDVANKPSIGISSLEGLRYNVPKQHIVCSILDAKNENVYYALYEENSPIIEPQFFSVTAMIEALKEKKVQDITFVGDGAILYQQELKQAFPNAHFSEENKTRASSIGKAAYDHMKEKRDLAPLTPLYLRKSQAERVLEEGKENASHHS